MPRKVPPARLDPVIYEAWLGENPKLVQEGPLELKPCDGTTDEDAVNLEAHRVSSDVLDTPYADNLYIYGFHSKYEGFKIYVKDGHGYLLMAHQTHSNGTFRSDDGREFGDHPHFHLI